LSGQQSAFYAFHQPQTGLKSPQGFPSDFWYQNCSKQSLFPELPDVENRVILRLLVLTHYQHVTDGRTDGQKAGNRKRDIPILARTEAARLYHCIFH